MSYAALIKTSDCKNAEEKLLQSWHACPRVKLTHDLRQSGLCPERSYAARYTF